ncbi:MAG: DNA primase [Oscillospiraceae bacterium]|nr:DNA primase [Oscillospiraceae bacterium]
MALPDAFLDELVSRTDIVELVSGYVRLGKRSGTNMFGLCPFHSEKTPSFSVNSEKQIYYCFGCGKGGGAIGFIREIENLPFRDAVEVLARRAGMTVPEEAGQLEVANRRRKLLELNRDAARHFHTMLSSPLCTSARDYLVQRGITKASATRFGLGAAPDSWTTLLDAMQKKGYKKTELIEAGLCRPGRGGEGAYDFFRNRLMFPVIDVRGNVIAFSGRILDDGEPKYINSPDTVAFTKSRNMYALNFAKNSKAGNLLLVEGNIDVVTLHQAGFDSAVAPLGTAFTAEQARLMASYTETVIIAFDPDEAGKKATLRALPLLEATGKKIKVVDLGTSGDPDDYIRKRGADAFKALLRQGESQTDYRLLTISKSHDMQTDEGRLSYLAKATDILAEINNMPQREIYAVKVAKEGGVSVSAVNTEIEKRVKAKTKAKAKNREREVMRPKTNIQPASRELRYDNEASAVAEEGIIRCLMRDPTLIKIALETGFSHTEFTSTFLEKVYITLESRISEDREVKMSLILNELESSEASQLMRIMDRPEALADNDKTIHTYIEKIRSEKLRTHVPDTDTLLKIRQQKTKSTERNGE